MSDKINEKLNRIIIKTLSSRIEEKMIMENTDLITDLGFDSFHMVQLIIDIESEFGFEFDYSELNLNKIRKYNVIKNYIMQKVSCN